MLTTRVLTSVPGRCAPISLRAHTCTWVCCTNLSPVRAADPLDGDRIPVGLVDRSRRIERIREASRQLTERHRRLEEADHARDAAARQRLAGPRLGCRS